VELVKPAVHLVGVTAIDEDELRAYLEATDQMDFMATWEQAMSEGVSPAEAICSVFAKLCYKSLTPDKNDNITRVRDISGNIASCFDTGHGSVFEHVMFNFIIRDCSRVFTHELVRHRIGTAFSQTSGRYCRSDNLQVVLADPIVDAVKLKSGKSLMDRMQEMAQTNEDWYNEVVEDIEWGKDFATKKKVTSYLRRLLPNGQGNEIAFSVNLRSLRHLVQMRTGRHAEWEIRFVFEQVYKLIKAKHKNVFYGAVEEEVGGLLEVSGMKMQPYEDMRMFSDEEMNEEMKRRGLPHQGPAELSEEGGPQ